VRTAWESGDTGKPSIASFQEIDKTGWSAHNHNNYLLIYPSIFLPYFLSISVCGTPAFCNTGHGHVAMAVLMDPSWGHSMWGDDHVPWTMRFQRLWPLGWSKRPKLFKVPQVPNNPNREIEIL
jgi:hypothetical protein